MQPDWILDILDVFYNHQLYHEYSLLFSVMQADQSDGSVSKYIRAAGADGDVMAGFEQMVGQGDFFADKRRC